MKIDITYSLTISVLTWEYYLAANFTFIPLNAKYCAMKRYYALRNEYIEMHSTPGKNSKSTGNIVLNKVIFNQSYDIAYSLVTSCFIQKYPRDFYFTLLTTKYYVLKMLHINIQIHCNV